jgi:hypothetical protein
VVARCYAARSPAAEPFSVASSHPSVPDFDISGRNRRGKLSRRGRVADPGVAAAHLLSDELRALVPLDHRGRSDHRLAQRGSWRGGRRMNRGARQPCAARAPREDRRAAPCVLPSDSRAPRCARANSATNVLIWSDAPRSSSDDTFAVIGRDLLRSTRASCPNSCARLALAAHGCFRPAGRGSGRLAGRLVERQSGRVRRGPQGRCVSSRSAFDIACRRLPR